MLKNKGHPVLATFARQSNAGEHGPAQSIWLSCDVDPQFLSGPFARVWYAQVYRLSEQGDCTCPKSSLSDGGQVSTPVVPSAHVPARTSSSAGSTQVLGRFSVCMG